jgi:TonB family protein
VSPDDHHRQAGACAGGIRSWPGNRKRWRRVKKHAAVWLLAGTALLVSRAAGAQDFYETRLRAGEDSLRGDRPLEAISNLKIAAFGFLDRPPLLEEALACLALAQERAGHGDDEQSTLSRFVEVERRFPSWRRVSMPADLRVEFLRLARSRVAASVMASLPAFAEGAPPPEAPPRQAEVRPPVRTPTASPRRPPEPAPSGVGAGAETFTPEAVTVDVPPRARTVTRPVYPAAALRSGVGGVVLLRVLVSETGQPLQVEVVRGIRSDLADAAIAALQRWTFDPARKNGRPVRAWTTISIPFQP